MSDFELINISAQKIFLSALSVLKIPGGDAPSKAAALWNNWAQTVIEEKKILIKDGCWFAHERPHDGPRGGNDATIAWLKKSCLDITEAWESDDNERRDEQVLQTLDLTDWVFPGNVRISSFSNPIKIVANHTKFMGNLNFYAKGLAPNISVEFVGTEFQSSFLMSGHGIASIKVASSKFAQDVELNSCNNCTTIEFISSRVGGKFTVNDITLDNSQKLEFTGLIIDGNTEFTRCIFSNKIDFEDSAFHGTVNFKKVNFDGPDAKNAPCSRSCGSIPQLTDHTNFTNVDFNQTVTFEDCSFNYACFAGMKCKQGLLFKSDISFSEVPDFDQASFAEAPRFDNVFIANNSFFIPKVDLEEEKTDSELAKTSVKWNRILSKFYAFPSWLRLLGPERAQYGPTEVLKGYHVTTPSSRYRSLRRLAIEGYDAERYLDFGAEELKNRRFHEDFPTGPTATRFWLSYFYGMISSYGRSIFRPLILWVLLVVIYALFYVNPIGGRSIEFSAEYHSIQNSRVFRGKKIAAYFDAISQCIYPKGTKDAFYEALSLSVRNGLFITPSADSKADGQRLGCLYGSLKSDSSQAKPNIPVRYRLIASTQNFLSLVFLFLVGLGIRNSLRLK